MTRLIDADEFISELTKLYEYAGWDQRETHFSLADTICNLDMIPTVDAVPVPAGGIGELSDGYHTFNGLYYQRMMLFAVLVKTHKDYSWKSRRHSDGEPCFGGGWFIVGIDTPHGSYTYHYEDKFFDLFDCIELSKGKEWDGHTEDDVTRLLSLDAVPVTRCKDCRFRNKDGECTQFDAYTSAAGDPFSPPDWFYCGYGKRKGESENV